MRFRTLAGVVPGLPTADGNGVPLRRIFPTGRLSLVDPFLLLDHFGPLTLSPGSDVGFPPHPHRGFQTLTYLIQGAFAHRDSTGGQGLLRPGGAQLMTAGSGIVHEEMPLPEAGAGAKAHGAQLRPKGAAQEGLHEDLETGGAIEGLQLWINLPRDQKWSPPGYRDLQPETMPWQAFPGGRLRALAGDWLGAHGPAETPVPIAYAHLELEAGTPFEHRLPEGWNAGVYVLHGAVSVGNARVGAGNLALLSLEGDGLDLVAEDSSSLILLGGRPLNEPLARGGPFVMNTEAEIQQAFADYRAGLMGFLD